jgi:predicted nucleic acid-binding Zn ribbon protein
MLEEETFPECPNCQVTMGRKYEAAPVHLKGGGFYKNGG